MEYFAVYSMTDGQIAFPVTDLRWNNIGLLGGRALLEAVQNNKSVVQLQLAGNNIPSDTLKALGKALCVFLHALGCSRLH